MNGWISLIFAGFFEVGFTTMMKLSNGFSRPVFGAGFLVCAVTSFYFLNRSLTQIPIGTAYAIWTGIGAFGTAVIGMVFFRDPATPLRMLFLLTLIGSIVGLRFVAAE
ncbi:MAG: cation transporter [Bdellovibrionales bacterium GWB1_55_8]|nr:MAG: cation transporter [Bdellovibrionales bacterium GWB1_55_8]